jgi:site-specific DNA-methyltransferase (adenine-specific)
MKKEQTNITEKIINADGDSRQVDCFVIPPTNTVENIDCMEMLRKCPPKHFDLAIVDPPYGLGAGRKNKYHPGAFTEYIPKKWDSERPTAEYFEQLFRVSKNQIIWGGNYFTEFLPISKNWIVWDKKQPEGISFSMHELAFYSGDGQAKIFRGYNGANRCVVPSLAKKYLRIHPTQKPIELYKWLLKNYGKQGDLILDTHVGSGSSIVACIECGFNYYGCEIDKDYYDAAMKRIGRAFRKYELFENEAV